MTRTGAWIVLLALALLACGKYGPPTRYTERSTADPAASALPADDEDEKTPL